MSGKNKIVLLGQDGEQVNCCRATPSTSAHPPRLVEQPAPDHADRLDGQATARGRSGGTAGRHPARTRLREITGARSPSCPRLGTGLREGARPADAAVRRGDHAVQAPSCASRRRSWSGGSRVPLSRQRCSPVAARVPGWSGVMRGGRPAHSRPGRCPGLACRCRRHRAPPAPAGPPLTVAPDPCAGRA
jgi:hypothetical protein